MWKITLEGSTAGEIKVFLGWVTNSKTETQYCFQRGTSASFEGLKSQEKAGHKWCLGN